MEFLAIMVENLIIPLAYMTTRIPNRAALSTICVACSTGAKALDMTTLDLTCVLTVNSSAENSNTKEAIATKPARNATGTLLSF